MLVRSDKPPKNGSRNKARILSAAMMMPVRDSSILKVSRRIRGTTLSYICQKAHMDRNASPTRMVLLLFSFSSFIFTPLCAWAHIPVISGPLTTDRRPGIKDYYSVDVLIVS